MTAKPTAAKKTAPRKRAVPRRPAAVEDPGGPPLEAVDTPPAKPRKRTPNNKRRGATAPPSPDELVALRERERVAVGLAAAGVDNWDEIARLAGYEDRSSAWKAVQRALDRQEFAAVADYRRLVGYRYERIVRSNWEAAISATESTAKDKATGRVFKALEGLRRTFGLDLEVDKLADAMRIPESETERREELTSLRDQIRLLQGGLSETG